MNADQLEKAAYWAAHRILMANTSAPDLACPGARRSHAIDTIANIIKDVFETRGDDPGGDHRRWDSEGDSGAHHPARRDHAA